MMEDVRWMMEERAKNQTRVTLKDVNKMLDGMNVELAGCSLSLSEGKG